MNLSVFTNSLIGALWVDVFRYLKRQGCRHHEAEDLTQEVFMSLSKNHGFDRPGTDQSNISPHERNYVIKAARYALIDQRRSEQAAA